MKPHQEVEAHASVRKSILRRGVAQDDGEDILRRRFLFVSICIIHGILQLRLQGVQLSISMRDTPSSANTKGEIGHVLYGRLGEAA